MNAITITAETSRQKPPPPGFAEVFIRWGWRGIETAFGSRTECNKRWVAQCGGDELKAQRRAYQVRLMEVKHARAA